MRWVLLFLYFLHSTKSAFAVRMLPHSQALPPSLCPLACQEEGETASWTGTTPPRGSEDPGISRDNCLEKDKGERPRGE